MILTLLVGWSFLACNNDLKQETGTSGPIGDDDKDGVTTEGGDCNDDNNTVFPGAEELCDGIDNNCDGQIDEPGAGGESVWYADQDGDGEGNALSVVVACDAPVGYVPVGGDCNDTDATVTNYAAEICDGLDNDCDGLTDEAGASGEATWFEDLDGDTYGSASSVVACNQPAGYSADNSDCDDSNNLIYPGAIELCDGLDNDCDGSVDELGASGEATWYLDADSDGYGSSNSVVSCSQPTGYVANNSDCNDNDVIS